MKLHKLPQPPCFIFSASRSLYEMKFPTKKNLWTLATLLSILTDRKIVVHLFASPHSFPCNLLTFIQVMKKSACLHAKLLQSCPILCDPMDLARQVLLSMGISRQEYWSGLPSSRGSSQPRDRIHVFCVSCIAGRVFIS